MPTRARRPLRVWTALAVVVGLTAATCPSYADDLQDLEQAAHDAAASCLRAAAHVADDDRPRALNDAALALGRASVAAALVDGELAVSKRKRRTIEKLTAKLVGQVGEARTLAQDTAQPPAAVADALRRAAKTAHVLTRKTGSSGTLAFNLKVTRSRWDHAARRKVKLRVKNGVLADGSPCSGLATCEIENTGAIDAVVLPHTEQGNGKYRVELGPDPGAAEIRVTLCGTTRTFVLFNRGGKGAIPKTGTWGDGGEPATTAIRFGQTVHSLRVDTEAEVAAPIITGGAPDSFSVTPALPAGLEIERRTGAIVGHATVTSQPRGYTITAVNELGGAQTTISLQVTPGLPAEIIELEPGFVAEKWVAGAQAPVKMAYLPDGRLLYSELAEGNVRVVATDGSLRATPFATLAVHAVGERGLIGLAVAPDFVTTGHVFVFRHRPPAGEEDVVGEVVRLTATGAAGAEVGTDPTLILTGIPSAILQNGGDLQFGPVDGKLYVSTGDTNDEDLSQTDGSLAGRILRIERDGSIPADNPDPASPDWTRGMRNSFDLTFHPVTHGMFGTENGPMAEDELNFIQKGRNFEWGPLDPEFPAVFRGLRLMQWTPVIVPTGLTFHSGNSFGDAYANNLFIGGYDEADVRRLPMSGPAFTDIDDEIEFAVFDVSKGIDHRPLDLLEAPDGSLLVSTFTAIWRIYRW